MKKKILFLLTIAIGFGARGTFAQQESRQKQPNILFILVDDWGWTDLSASGSKFYETPNIDKLAKAGLKFTQAYSVGPNCAPSKVTGLLKTEIQTNGVNGSVGGDILIFSRVDGISVNRYFRIRPRVLREG